MSGKSTKTVEQRLRARVSVSAAGCWIMLGPVDRQGYSRIYADGAKRLAHRVAHELFIGPIPEGHEVDHLCGLRSCVNPAHLEAVTPLENTRRAGAGNARKTRCDHGHEFTPENTRIVERRNGKQRACRRCDARRAREHRARKAAA